MKIILHLISITLLVLPYIIVNSELHLDSNDFNTQVIGSNELWLVKFYRNNFSEENETNNMWNKLLSSFSGMVKFASINISKEAQIAKTYNIFDDVSIKIFSINKATPIDISLTESVENIIKSVSDQMKEVIFHRLKNIKEKPEEKSGEKESSKTNRDESSQKNQQKQPTSKATKKNKQNSTGQTSTEPNSSAEDAKKQAETQSKMAHSEKHEAEYSNTHPNSKVIVLTDKDFINKVYSSPDLWLVVFTVPWCSHCKTMEDDWEKLAQYTRGIAKVARINSDLNKQISDRFKVVNLPKILIFPPGEKKDELVTDFKDNDRSLANVSSFVLKLVSQFGIVPLVEQLTNQRQYEDHCVDSELTCVISFYPNLFDSSAQQRRTYMETFNKGIVVGLLKPINFLWVQGGDFFEYEEKLGMSFGFPVVMVINHNKNKFAIMRDSFEEENIKTFVQRLLIGRVAFYDIPKGLPKLKKVDNWDGKDLENLSVDDL